MELDLALAARRAAASMSTESHTEWLTLKAATSMTTPLSILCACILKLSLNLPPSPQWRLTFCSRGWQGGGLFIWGTATLTNTNVHYNEATAVCSPSAPAQTFPPSPQRSLTSSFVPLLRFCLHRPSESHHPCSRLLSAGRRSLRSRHTHRGNFQAHGQPRHRRRR
jgi:hypothetical protein